MEAVTEPVIEEPVKAPKREEKFSEALEIFDALNTHYPAIKGVKLISNGEKPIVKVVFGRMNLQKSNPVNHSALYQLDLEA